MTEIDVLKQLEKELKIELFELDEIEWESIGYTLNRNGQVTGLCLNRCEIKSLERIISPLSALTNLTQLVLSYNELSDLSPLSALTNLTQLVLSYNELSDLSPLSALTNLTQLYLSDNELSDLSPLSTLTNLILLYLSDNELSNLSPLFALTNLTRLVLYNNQLSDLSPLSTLTNLTRLVLYNNQLSDLSPLSTLTNLTQLDLGNNQLSDLSPLSTLTNLTRLVLYNNQLSDLSPLSTLTNLTQLVLSYNELSDLSPLSALTNLTQLNLSYNKLSDLSPLSALTNLTQLDLSDNPLSDISLLRVLVKLKELNLRTIPLKELPSWITEFEMEIQWKGYGGSGYITFDDNPLKRPPPEIVKQGKAAVRNYFEQLRAQEEDYLFEAKMLIVGEPGAGKSSMAWKIENANCAMPEEADTTRGIEVRQYYFPLQKEDFAGFKHPEKLKKKEFRLNLWDFGGQEIYKATHRFFLTKRSLYVLVADSRNEDTDFNYWLHIVEMFGGESPLLIVLNEKYQRKRNLDTSAMRQRFTNILGVLDVDFAEEDKSRLNRLKTAVRYYVSQLPHIGSPVPAKWATVREALENDQRNTITLQDYMAICKANGVAKPQDAMVLSQYFHDIGVFLHFQDDELLNKTIFLKPNWATNAVYKILDHELLNQRNGRFNREEAKIIWAEDQYEFIRDELLRLMQKFFLTYEIHNTGEYIVPERLPPAQPDYPWPETDNLFLRYEYDFFMPKGLMSQLTVQMHRYIRNHDYVWRRGVVLEREDTIAEIVETYDARTIKIRIAGQNRRDFMTIITEQLDQINAQYEKMKVEKLIPCNCSVCKTGDNPFFYQYQDLKRRLEKGRREIECGLSYEMVNVRGLIDEVINEVLRETREREMMAHQNYDRPEKVKRDKVFVSYSHKDGEWLKRVQTHLRVLENLGITINLWDDTQIKPGMIWRNEIEKALSAAKVAILLVSTDFLASDFIRTDELPPLLKAAEHEGAIIIPIILKPCLFDSHKSLAEFQAVNSTTKPLSKLTKSKQDEMLVALARRIAELVSEGE
jgi:internalin A